MGWSLRKSPGQGNLWHHSVALRGGGLTERTMLLLGLWSIVWEEAVSPVTLHFLPICPWCPSSCFLGAESQRGGSAWVLSLLWALWEDVVSSATPIPTGVYSQTLFGLIFLGLGPWAGWSGLGLGPLTPEVSLPFFIHHMWVWDQPFPSPRLSRHSLSPHLSMSWPLLPVWNECGFFKSLVVRLPHSSIFSQSWVIFVL